MHENEEKSEKSEKEEKNKENSSATKSSLPTLWMIATIILAIALVAVLVVHFGMPTGFVTGSSMTGQAAAQKAIDFLNKYIVQEGTSASVAGVNESNGLYVVDTLYRGQHIPLYVTKDGRLLLSLIADTSFPPPQEEPSTQPSNTIAKSDRPKVELFVMSFCPYGVQAEKALKPVVDLLGDSADFIVRFIVNVGGNNISQVSSLHGNDEAKEDARQACIQKHYNTSTYWNYLWQIDNTCYPSSTKGSALETCWKNAANVTGINVTLVEECAYGVEGIDLLRQDESISNANSVTGSPTLIINGGRYSGARTSDAFKTAICGAFNTAPSVCGQTINDTGGTATGSCG